jgi:hypothetical protein
VAKRGGSASLLAFQSADSCADADTAEGECTTTGTLSS